jgi:hypothetical protein
MDKDAGERAFSEGQNIPLDQAVDLVVLSLNL